MKYIYYFFFIVFVTLTSCNYETFNYGAYSYSRQSDSLDTKIIDNRNDTLSIGQLKNENIKISDQVVLERKIIKIPDLSNLMKNQLQDGQIVVKHCINPRGDVTYVEVINEETTIKDKALVIEALKIAFNYKFAHNPTAPDQECGKFTFKLVAK